MSYAELAAAARGTMEMCGAPSVAEIGHDVLWG